MDTPFYIDQFQQAAEQIDQSALHRKQVELAVGVYFDSVFLKLYKKKWATTSENPLTAESRIFFSVWINDLAIKQQTIHYNIHALKLRKLKGYAIESRKFAEAFRQYFKAFEHTWQDVQVNMGPLTLMEGRVKTNPANLQPQITRLAYNFLEIEYLIDDTLDLFKK